MVRVVDFHAGVAVSNLSMFLFLLVSLILEHYTMECNFGNFDTKNNKKATAQIKHKNFWLNFCLN